MKKLWISLVSITVFVLLVSWQANTKQDNYARLWKKVKQYSQKDLPKSALKTVNLIYAKAKAEGNESQVIKALINRISLQSSYQEGFRSKSIYLFEKEWETAPNPEKQLLGSLLGQLYQGYFHRHLIEILNRKTSATNDTALETLNAKQWNLKIRKAYLSSVSSPELLKKIPLGDFSVVLQNDSNGYKLWPTLYDLLANRAIGYFSSNDARRWLPKSETAPDTSLFAPAADFLKMNFFREKNSPTGSVLLLFQHLLRLHQANHHKAAFADIDLKRLDFVKSLLPGNFATETAFSHALENELQQYNQEAISVEIASRLAQTYLRMGQYRQSNTNFLLKAEKICKKALQDFPTAPFANNCKNILSQINQPAFGIQMQQALLPDKSALALVRVKNSPKLWFKIVRIPAVVKPGNTSDNVRTQMQKYLGQPAFKSWSQTFPFSPDHKNHTAEIAIPALPAGLYVVFVSDNSRFTEKTTVHYQKVQVTQLAMLSKKNNHAQALDVYLLKRSSGRAVSKVVVKIFASTYNYRSRQHRLVSLGTFSTDNNGFVQIPLKQDDHYNGFILEAAKDGDTTLVNTFARFYGSLYKEKPYKHTYFFTDRAIYRPGQTVYFKAVEVTIKGNNAHIEAGRKVDVQLLNAQYKKLNERHLVTDASGSVSGSFVLPNEALNGRFILKTSTGMKGFLMENYKRPAFYVDFDTLKRAYALNEKVTVTGKVAYYFGGIPKNIPVRYTVKRESYFPMPYFEYGYPFPSVKKNIAAGTVHTDSKGTFHIAFQSLADKNIPGKACPVYRFVIHAEATDASGETHTATHEIRLSRLAVLLKIHAGSNIIREHSPGIGIETRNLSGAKVPAAVQVKLYRLSAPDNYFLKRLWPKPDTVLIGRDYFVRNFPHYAFRNENDKNSWKKTLLVSEDIPVQGNRQFLAKRIKKLKPGEYLLLANVKEEPEASVHKFFTLLSARSSRLPSKTVFWHHLSSTKAEPGDVLKLDIGSASGSMRMFYEIQNGREIVHRQWITTGKKLTKLEIPVSEPFRGNFVVRLMSIEANRLYSWTQTVQVPFTNKKLSVSLQTSRNYLKPGEKEHWAIKIKTASGKSQPAFLLAGMYDASLDVYAANHWKMFPYRTKIAGQSWRSYLFGTSYNRSLFSEHTPWLPETRIHYPRINWFGYPVFSQNTPVYHTVGRQLEMENEVVPAPTAQFLAKEKKVSNPSALLPPEKKKPVQPLRTNFNATAFFYPNLLTDSTGSVHFHFTTPDALTQWKFMALAYTKDMKTGNFEKNFVARKALMVIPNLPRFVRQGDRLVFTARLSNLSKKTLPVKVTIEFFNPENGEKLPVFITRKATARQVSIASGNNALVSWLIRIPKNIQFLAYRIKAVSGENSDGEQRMIPVLNNRTLITESMPLFIAGNQQKTFVFNHFLHDTSASRKNFRYTLTFTSHPAWYAVQALPYLDKTTYESSENIFYRFYAHALAGSLLKAYPRIQQVFQQWKQQSPDVFLSALQKNRELKDIVLQATPWVLDARTETEQKRRIALFFDLNQMQQKQQTALNRLMAAQLPSGAWPWFQDMPADFFTTENILSGIADLIRMKAIDLNQQPALKKMLQKGLRFLDNEMARKYSVLEKRYPKTLNNNHLTQEQIRYCYLRSGFPATIPAGKEAQKAFDYFSGQIKKYWPRLNNNLQALSAITLNRLGWGNQAEAIIRALNEKSLLNKENGMYWRSNNRYTNQSDISTEVNIMKAFAEVMNDTRSVDKMKTWLLMQKQANYWPGTKATADAVYALLMNGSPLLSETSGVKIKLGNGEKLPGTDLPGTAGSGFIKKVWTNAEIVPALGKITVSNPNKGMAYGSAYWQYFENLDEVSHQAGAVSIEKALFKEVRHPKGNEWVKVSEDAPLQLGNRIMVRLIIHATRAIDFIHVQDMRAATFEPETLLSSYKTEGGLRYYEEIKDAATHFFIRHLPRGTFVLEYPLLVTQKGSFTEGIARIQSLYLPSMTAHSSGIKIKVQ